MPRTLLLTIFAALAAAGVLAPEPAMVQAGEFTVQAEARTDFKAVFGRVESRDMVQARARIGGTIVSLAVEEGSPAQAGAVIARVVDDKLALHLGALDARLKELEAQIQNAAAELARGKSLFASGTIAKSRLDALQTQVDVLANQAAATQSERAVIVQQGAEGDVLAPASGRVLSVPVTKGSVIMPGETIARIAGGGYFLRLSLPERHAAQISEGDDVFVGGRGVGSAAVSFAKARKGKLVKVYPEIEGGLVLADVEVDGLGDFFAGERTLVWIPVDQRRAISVPPESITTRYGIDYVSLVNGAEPMDVAVITGEKFETGKGARIEILSGLRDGDKVAAP